MNSPTDNLDFVTVEGLLRYGEALARRTSSEGIDLPPPPVPSAARSQRVRRAHAGRPSAEIDRAERRALLARSCGGDDLVWFAAWNRLLAEGELAPLYRAPIGTVQKPVHRRLVAIIPRAHLTSQLAEGRIVLD